MSCCGAHLLWPETGRALLWERGDSRGSGLPLLMPAVFLQLKHILPTDFYHQQLQSLFRQCGHKSSPSWFGWCKGQVVHAVIHCSCERAEVLIFTGLVLETGCVGEGVIRGPPWAARSAAFRGSCSQCLLGPKFLLKEPSCVVPGLMPKVFSSVRGVGWSQGALHWSVSG